MRFHSLFLSCLLGISLAAPALAEETGPTPAEVEKAVAQAVEQKNAAEARAEKLAAAKAKRAAARAAKLAAARARAAKLAAARAARAKAKSKAAGTAGVADTATAGASTGSKVASATGSTGTTSSSAGGASSTAGEVGSTTGEVGSTKGEAGSSTGESGSTTGASGSTSSDPSDPVDGQDPADPAPTITPYIAFAWHAPTSPLDHVAAPLWYVKDSDPAAIASQLNALPAGERVLLRWQSTELLMNPGDQIVGPDGQNYYGPWLDNGAAAEAAFENSFLAQVAADGGSVDYLMLDIEWDINTWNITTGQLNAILADPRYPALASTFDLTRTDDLIDILNPDSQAFDLAMQVTMGTYDHAAFDAPLAAHFPDARCSDFNDALLSPSAAIEAPDANGCVQPAGLPLHGDTQGPSFYGDVGNIGLYTNNQGADFTQPLPILCWETSRARGYALADVPIIPWVAGKTWSQDSLANSPYYDEMIYHVMLSSGSVNLDLWDADTDHTQDDCSALDADLAAVAQMANNEPALTPLSTDTVPYTSPVLVSGAQCPSGRQLFRITVPAISTQAQTVNVVLPGDTATTAVTVPANAAGQWLVR